MQHNLSVSVVFCKCNFNVQCILLDIVSKSSQWLIKTKKRHAQLVLSKCTWGQLETCFAYKCADARRMAVGLLNASFLPGKLADAWTWCYWQLTDSTANLPQPGKPRTPTQRQDQFFFSTITDAMIHPNLQHGCLQLLLDMFQYQKGCVVGMEPLVGSRINSLMTSCWSCADPWSPPAKCLQWAQQRKCINGCEQRTAPALFSDENRFSPPQKWM